MRTVINEFWHKLWHSAKLWALLVGSVISMVILMTFFLWLQRADMQRQIDKSALQSVEQIDARVKAAIAELRAQDVRSTIERNAIKQEVGQIKEEIKAQDGNR